MGILFPVLDLLRVCLFGVKGVDEKLWRENGVEIIFF